jgi:hypothetical protein
MMKQTLCAVLILTILIALSCKEDEAVPNFPPAFEVYQEPGNLEHLYARCLTEEISLDTVIVTDPINIKYNRYFQGRIYQKNEEIDLGDTFIPTQGKWSFIIRGSKASSGTRFSVYVEHDF